MKTIRTLLAIASLSASVLAYAQFDSFDSMSVNIPFAFQVDGKAMPAGHYTVRRGSENVLMINEIGGRHGTLLFANPDPYAPSRNRSSLIFLRTGDQYRLAEVNCGYVAMAYHVRQSKSRYAAEKFLQIATLVADPR